MKTGEYFGIDYGFGMCNIDTETGIRVGVIPWPEVSERWIDKSESDFAFLCSGCSVERITRTPMDACLICGYEEDLDFLEDLESVSYVYEEDGYSCFSDARGDIMIVKAPYFTYAQLCSPCAPGACYLMSAVSKNNNNRAYCFGHDWFESGKAPYTVYDVKTGKEVKP